MRRPCHGALCALVLAGCSAPAAPPAAGRGGSRAQGPEVAALRLGHYASADGTVGLILERKPTSARIKLDGTSEVIELDAQRSVAGRTDYIRSIGHTVLQVHDDGRVTVYLDDRPGGIALRRDGDVDLVDGSVTHHPAPAACCKDGDPPPVKDQPPEVKLKLGHYRNRARGIGVTVDRTGDPAKLKFDGADEVIRLDKHVNGDRTDYFRRLDQVVLQVWSDGRVVVYVAGATGGIEVRRDGDADPL